MVQISAMHLSYRRTKVFDGIDLDIERGRLYGLLGKNGAGKSTLLYTMAGLLKPQQGKVDVLGYIPHLRLPDFLTQVFLIPEEFHLPDISLSSFVKHYAVFYPGFSHTLFSEYLQMFDIPDTTLLKMSYGQKKKVLISFALASRARLLLMDEPTNGLDIISKAQFKKVMARALNDELSIIISSHQVQDLTNLIDRIVILDHAKIVLNQTLDEIGKRLTFSVANDPELVSRAFYAEPVLGGSYMVIPADLGRESQVDLELLYKAVMANADGLQFALND